MKDTNLKLALCFAAGALTLILAFSFMAVTA